MPDSGESQSGTVRDEVNHVVEFVDKQFYDGEWTTEIPAQEVERMGAMTGVKCANGEHISYDTDKIEFIRDADEF